MVTVRPRIMKSYHLRIFLLLFSLAGPVVVHDLRADEPTVCAKPIQKAEFASTMNRVETRYSEINDLHAQFLQESFFLGLGEKKTSSGTLTFAKPGKMNWDYREPEKQHFISNGKTLWFYQPTLNQVTISPFQQSFQSDLPVSFLLGLGKLSEDFSLESGCVIGDRISLVLAPKNPDKEIQQFSLTVDAKDFTPRGATIRDPGGNETTIKLQHAEINSGTRSATFEFAIPKGADVIYADQAAPKPSTLQ